ncbi:Vacuolar import/degradation protein Vid24 [Macrophomina phaseolina MS6]|uniref:Vacuolar import/degradation protein Vid24 n=2 Tax=Macrophomina phaseolina TaxID=35725 RepID=K2R3W4_MACPH|nr:Vacuolar import/degradation protein Vid24 [Macrophomina phaseolina MS6]
MEDALPYSDRVPSRNSLYDWSPPNETADDQEDLQEMLRSLRQEPSTTFPRRPPADAARSEQRSRTYSSRYAPEAAQSSESSLRSTQSRRHPRFSARSRETMQRYITEQDAAIRNAQDGSDASRIETSRYGWHLSGRSNESRDRALERDIRARQDSYRRSYLENPSSTPSSSSLLLEMTIKYLSKIRNSDSYEDSLYHAADAGFVTKEFFGENHQDFILDVSMLPKPAETSWLAPGAVFSGSQHATTVTSNVTSSNIPTPTSTTLYRFRNNESPMTSTTFDASRPWMSHNPIPPHARRAGDSSAQQTQQQDRWPVKVTIHAVDWENMTLAATMEAYNVPSHPPPFPGSTLDPAAGGAPRPGTRTSSITTYLEGEILDLHTHTLLTESFKSSPATDATYWRKLPPFAHLRDADLVHRLVSHEYVSKLSQEWILMRWKERCFVKSTSSARRRAAAANHAPSTSSSTTMDTEASASPQYSSSRDIPPFTIEQDEDEGEDGCGLTISGFYYVCLRRSDGAIEGLYYDPQSSPYQHLKLHPVGGGSFPVWNFR